MLIDVNAHNEKPKQLRSILACAAYIKIYYGAVFLVSIPYYLLHNKMVSILIFMRLILCDRSLDAITRIEQITDGSIVI